MPAASPSDPTGFETLESFSRANAFNRWQFDEISNQLQGRVLEIGSGIGNISQYLLEYQPTVALSDLRPEYCQILENKFGPHPHLTGIFPLDLSRTDFNTRYHSLLGKFDTVIALNVVEHIADDSLAIRNAASLMQVQGRLVILVPAGQWLFNSLDRELGHIKRYSKRRLKDIMVPAGLTVSHTRYFNAAAMGGWWLSGNILRQKIISSSGLNLYNKMVPVFRMADWFLSPFAGLSLISVGTKN